MYNDVNDVLNCSAGRLKINNITGVYEKHKFNLIMPEGLGMMRFYLF